MSAAILERARRQERARVELHLLRALHRTAKAYVTRAPGATLRALEAGVQCVDAWEASMAAPRRPRRTA